MLMGDLLEEFFRRPYIAAKIAEGKLPDTWRAIVGDRAADVTTELRLDRHILYVRIQSSVLRSELFYQRDALRDEINRRAGMQLVNAVIVRGTIPGSLSICKKTPRHGFRHLIRDATDSRYSGLHVNRSTKNTRLIEAGPFLNSPKKGCLTFIVRQPHFIAYPDRTT